MAVTRTEGQLEALRAGDPTERLALVSLLAVRDPAAWPAFLAAHDAAMKASGGRRAYLGHVDALLCGGAVRADWLAIDELPSRELAAEALRLENPHAKEALADALVLTVRPGRIPRLALALARLHARLLGRGAAGAQRSLTHATAPDPAIDPDPRDLESFLAAAPERPLTMLNLNRYRERAHYGAAPPADPEVSGREAYARYGRNTLPFVLRRGAGPVFAGEPVGMVVGSDGHPLAAAWDELLLVHYARRAGMLEMLRAPAYQAGIPHRHAGLERAALIATSPA